MGEDHSIREGLRIGCVGMIDGMAAYMCWRRYADCRGRLPHCTFLDVRVVRRFWNSASSDCVSLRNSRRIAHGTCVRLSAKEWTFRRFGPLQRTQLSEPKTPQHAKLATKGGYERDPTSGESWDVILRKAYYAQKNEESFEYRRHWRGGGIKGIKGQRNRRLLHRFYLPDKRRRMARTAIGLD